MAHIIHLILLMQDYSDFYKAATIKLIVSHDFDMVKPTLPPGKKMMARKKTNYKFI